MEKYIVKNNIKTFGFQVKNFPDGIGEAFHSLVKLFDAGDKRSYYGIFEMTKSGMVYYATAEETYDGEAEKYKCDRHGIERGEYLTELIHDWRQKTDLVKNVFQVLSEDKRVDKEKPGIEWYKDDQEMLCMLRTIQPK